MLAPVVGFETPSAAMDKQSVELFPYPSPISFILSLPLSLPLPTTVNEEKR